MLLLVEHRSRTIGARKLATELSDGQLSVVVHDRYSLAQLARSDWSFVEHLKREHLPVYGDFETLVGLLDPAFRSTGEIRQEIADHLPVAHRLKQPHGLAGRHLLAYGRLFASAYPTRDSASWDTSHRTPYSV